MAQAQLTFIATSKVKEIRKGASVTFDWGSYGPWKTFKNPTAASKKKVAYSKKAKNSKGAEKYGGAGGVTVHGSRIPATATKIIDGVSRTVDVRYYVRGYTKYTKTDKLKKDKKMYKTVYTKAKPYQYRLRYKDKAIRDAAYSSYSDGMDYLYFANFYYSGSTLMHRDKHLPHPVEFSVKYSDVRRNFESSANNSDGRDNHGSYVLSNVRANVVTLDLEWQGLKADDGADLLDTLNPSKDSKGKYNYLLVQYRDPAQGKFVNKTFYASSRDVEMYPNGMYKSIQVTLTEV